MRQPWPLLRVSQTYYDDASWAPTHSFVYFCAEAQGFSGRNTVDTDVGCSTSAIDENESLSALPGVLEGSVSNEDSKTYT